MNITELNNKLIEAEENFKKEVQTFKDGDFEEMGRQVYYALNDFRTNIIKYLKDNNESI